MSCWARNQNIAKTLHGCLHGCCSSSSVGRWCMAVVIPEHDGLAHSIALSRAHRSCMSASAHWSGSPPDRTTCRSRFVALGVKVVAAPINTNITSTISNQRYFVRQLSMNWTLHRAVANHGGPSPQLSFVRDPCAADVVRHACGQRCILDQRPADPGASVSAGQCRPRSASTRRALLSTQHINIPSDSMQWHELGGRWPNDEPYEHKWPSAGVPCELGQREEHDVVVDRLDRRKMRPVVRPVVDLLHGVVRP